MTRWRSLAAHGPPHEEPRVEAQDGREVELSTAADNNLRRVRHLSLVRGVGDKLLCQHVGRDRLIVLAHRRLFEPRPHAPLGALDLHQPHDAFAADQLAGVDQVFVHPRTPVPAPTRFV